MSAIYLVDPNGELSGPVTIPVVPGIGCQMPDNGIELDDTLPGPADGFVWVLVDGCPVTLADHRGTVYRTATGAPEQFDALGDLPEGLTLLPKPSPAHAWADGAWSLSQPLVDQLKEGAQGQIWEAIKVERDRRTVAGFNVGSVWVHSDEFSRIQWLGLKDAARDALVAGGTMASVLRDSDGEQIVWKMLGGSFVPVTAQLAFDVVAAVTCSDKAIFTVAEQHKVAMRAAEDPAAYDYSTGWPQTYAESVQTLPVDPETIPPEEPAPEPDPAPEEEAPQ